MKEWIKHVWFETIVREVGIHYSLREPKYDLVNGMPSQVQPPEAHPKSIPNHYQSHNEAC